MFYLIPCVWNMIAAQQADFIGNYNNLAETANFPVANGFVSLTRTFRYLGSLINYSLHDDDIIARIVSATAIPHLNIYNKYLLF